MPISTYAQRQIAADREHEARLKEHFDSLSDEEKLQWRELGLDQAPHDFHTERGVDVSEREDLEEIPERFAAKAEAKAIIGFRFIFAQILKARNKGLFEECACVAIGIIYDGDSEAEIARRHGVSRSAVSKIIIQFTNKLGLPPRGPMRALTLRKKYAHRATRVHIANDCRKVG